MAEFKSLSLSDSDDSDMDNVSIQQFLNYFFSLIFFRWLVLPSSGEKGYNHSDFRLFSLWKTQFIHFTSPNISIDGHFEYLLRFAFCFNYVH